MINTSTDTVTIKTTRIGGRLVVLVSTPNRVCHMSQNSEDALYSIRHSLLEKHLFNKSFPQHDGWIPCKGYGGRQLPIQSLPPPLTTAAPARVDLRREIQVIFTVRPFRVP